METPRGINVSKFINNSKLLLKFARVSLLPTDNAFSTLCGSKLYIYISEIYSRLWEIASYATDRVLRVNVLGILSGFILYTRLCTLKILSFGNHYLHFEFSVFPFLLPSLCFSSLCLCLYAPLPFSLSSVVSVGLSNGYQLVDLPCQPRSCGSEASELSWQAITF